LKPLLYEHIETELRNFNAEGTFKGFIDGL